MTNHYQTAMEGWKRKEGPHLINGRRVVKLPKMVIVMPPHSKLRQRETIWQKGELKIAPNIFNLSDTVVYPHPKDMAQFEKAVLGTSIGGPSYDYPGSIGSIGLTFTSMTDKPHLLLRHIQAHFKTKEGEYVLPRKLATKYGSWRIHALREIFKMAAHHNLPIILASDAILRHTIQGKRAVYVKDLETVAREMKFEIGKHSTTFHPPEKKRRTK
ncbi:MAG: hypothetical protein V1722_03600 [Candidatus Micrarchaeota archaeon]